MKKFLLSLVAFFVAISMFGQQRFSMYFVDATGAQVREVKAALNEDFIQPRLVFSDDSAQYYVRIEYGSTNPDVADIDMISGAVSLKAAGTTTITAVSGQTEQYYSARAQYNLIVEAPQDTTPAVEPECPDVYFVQNGRPIKELRLKVRESVSVPDLMDASGAIYTGGRVTIDSTNIAMVSADNMIYGLAEGYATLHVLIYQVVEGGAGQLLTCEYELPIVVEPAAQEKRSPELSWGVTDVYAELGAPFEAPVLSNPHNVPLNKIESQNPDVAEISPDGKEVYINGIGDAEIFAESFETDSFYAQSVHYFIHVYTIGLRVKGINVTSANAEDVLGDSSRAVTFEVESRTLHLSNWNIDASNLTGLEAMIEDDGFNVPLTIKLHGENSIKNANICVSALNVPVVVIGESQRDTWDLSATSVAVKAPYFKIHQCAVSAEAPLAALALGLELGVSINSHLLAKSQGLAIQTADLILADGEEGVAILTPGVHFEKGKGFLTEDKQYAKEVEIGKVPVIPPSEEVTTIDFTKTDPEGNETVVFSTSENDNYNQETGQLEISTQLTDAQVAEALETLVPGSSAWIDLLPGSLVFDIPAGEGKVRVNCMTLPGYKLQVKIEGKEAVSVEMVSLGWAEVTYNVPVPVHVVIYLHAPENASAPARIATRLNDTDAHAYIAAIEIAPKDAPQGIDLIDANTVENGSKLLIDGQLYIIREGRVFNASGAQVK